MYVWLLLLLNIDKLKLTLILSTTYFIITGRLLDVIDTLVQLFKSEFEDEAIPETIVTQILEMTETIALDLIPQQLELIRYVHSFRKLIMEWEDQ